MRVGRGCRDYRCGDGPCVGTAAPARPRPCGLGQEKAAKSPRGGSCLCLVSHPCLEPWGRWLSPAEHAWDATWGHGHQTSQQGKATVQLQNRAAKTHPARCWHRAQRADGSRGCGVLLGGSCHPHPHPHPVSCTKHEGHQLIPGVTADVLSVGTARAPPGRGHPRTTALILSPKPGGKRGREPLPTRPCSSGVSLQSPP